MRFNAVYSRLYFWLGSALVASMDWILLRRVLRIRSVGKAGPEPARVKRPGDGNVSRVESAALEWEFSAIYAVASGFR